MSVVTSPLAAGARQIRDVGGRRRAHRGCRQILRSGIELTEISWRPGAAATRLRRRRRARNSRPRSRGSAAGGSATAEVVVPFVVIAGAPSAVVTSILANGAGLVMDRAPGDTRVDAGPKDLAKAPMRAADMEERPWPWEPPP